MTNEKVRFVQAATPEEFFAQIRKAHKDVYEKDKERVRVKVKVKVKEKDTDTD